MDGTSGTFAPLIFTPLQILVTWLQPGGCELPTISVLPRSLRHVLGKSISFGVLIYVFSGEIIQLLGGFRSMIFPWTLLWSMIQWKFASQG